jgi:hypothetical protein
MILPRQSFKCLSDIFLWSTYWQLEKLIVRSIQYWLPYPN